MSNHADFIIASYGVTLLILGGMLFFSLRQYQKAKRRLHDAETDRGEGN